ncbi:MAG: hypothetical protein WA463_19125, partial [Terriglobales bacterium]
MSAVRLRKTAGASGALRDTLGMYNTHRLWRPRPHPVAEATSMPDELAEKVLETIATSKRI